MRLNVFLVVVLVLSPSLAYGQAIYSVDKDGCIVGQPCAFGVPLPPPKLPIYTVDADGCVVGQPCPWRGWRVIPKTKTTIDWLSGNQYETTRNPDGTTDVVGTNRLTGSRWDQHLDPATNSQSGHNKRGQFFSAPLTMPAHDATVNENSMSDFGTPQTFVFEPSEHDRWLADWWNKDKAKGGTQDSSMQSSTQDDMSAGDERRAFIDAYTREEARQKQKDIGRVLANMQPGSLAVAARAAARQRCLTIPDEETRNACLKDAESK